MPSACAEVSSSADQEELVQEPSLLSSPLLEAPPADAQEGSSVSLQVGRIFPPSGYLTGGRGAALAAAAGGGGGGGGGGQFPNLSLP